MLDMLDLVEQAVACSRQLIDLLDRLAHTPGGSPTGGSG
jgi:hypothetical protein